MLNRRTVASIAGLVVVAASLSVAGTAAAVTPAPRVAAPRALSPHAPAVPVKAASPWQPPRNYVMPQGNGFSFPNRTKAERSVIRNRVLYTIEGVWGGPRDRNHLPLPTNGTIRIATWSFNDMGIAKALVAAYRRGASVQIIAADTANDGRPSWRYLKKNLGQSYFKPGVPGSAEKVSFARECRGACRGHGGTPHAKYMLFDNVGAAHRRHVVMQTSMNLTRFAVTGQWNESVTYYSDAIYNNFIRIYRESRINRPVSSSYRRYVLPGVLNIFFPFPSANAKTDPVMQALSQVKCLGSTAGGSPRTKIRIIQYAIYDNRGVWIAKRLRALWNAGCDVQMIYSVATRPILEIMRSGSGRGPIPMKQSVITNDLREIVKYNHSKWMTIVGNWGASTASYITFAGSSNWSSAALTNDEQMQQIANYATARNHLANFATTWVQSSSHAPGYGLKAQEARLTPQGNTIPWGKGAFKFMTPEG